MDPLVPAEDAELIAGVPPELLPPSEGPVPDRPAWAGRPPKWRERGDSYRWLSYRDGYRAAARSRGLYRVVEKVTLPEELKPYRERLDQLTTTTVKDEAAQASLQDEVWAITQLLRSHADLTHTVLAGIAQDFDVNV